MFTIAFLGLLLGHSTPLWANLSPCDRLLTAYPEPFTDQISWEKIENALRTKIRTGWLRRGIPVEIQESVLEHSQKMRHAISLYAPHNPNVLLKRAMIMGLIHDMSEADAPDFTPHSKLDNATKQQIEHESWNRMVAVVPELAPLRMIWLEYEERRTPTSLMVKDLDILDAAVQALKYIKLGYTSAADFYPSARQKLKSPKLISILDLLYEKNYPLVSTYDQYFKLLEINGDPIKFKAAMEAQSLQAQKNLDDSTHL